MRMGSKRGLTGLLKGRNDYEYTRLGAQVQNVQDKTVYVFGEGDVCEDEVVEFEMSSIRSREPNHSRKKEKEKPLYVERHIAEGDTLQSLCLLYGCPVAEMKRVNNLINDQDFYALTRIKVPVKHNSFLIEQIEKDSEKISRNSSNPQLNGAAAASIDSEHEYGNATESDLELTTTDLSDPDTQNEVIRKISINKAARSNSSEAQKFLQNMDKDLSKIMKSKKSSKHSLDEVISVLTNKSVNPLVTKKSVNTWTDISVYRIAAIVLCVIVTIIVPILICIYIFTRGK